MANYSLIDRPGQLLTSQANAYMTILLQDLQSSQIQSKTDLIGAVAAIFQKFYNGVGMPMSSPMMFVGLPIAEDWNNYQTLTVSDINVLYQQAGAISNAVQNSYALENSELNLLTDAMNALSNRVASFNAIRPTLTGLQTWQLSDNFLNSSMVDIIASTNVVVLDGYVQLVTTGTKDFSNTVTLAIDDEYVSEVVYGDPNATGTGGSNGFVGNIHEVVVTDNTNPNNNTNTDSAIVAAVQLNAPAGETIVFSGDVNGIHADIKAVLDGNPSTWFEYEVCNVPDAFKTTPTLGYGFTIEIPESTGGVQQVPWFSFHYPNQTPQSSGDIFPAPPSTTQSNPLLPDTNSFGNFVLPSGVSSDPSTTSSINLSGSAGVVSIIVSSAPQSGGTLQLVLNGVLSQPAALTQITILPYVINGTRLITKSIQAQVTGTSEWVSATPLSVVQAADLVDIQSSAINLNAPDIWLLPNVEVTFISIVFQQTQSYQTSVGHVTWIEQISTDVVDPSIISSVIGGTIQGQQLPLTLYERVDGPNQDLALVLENPPTVLATIPGLSQQVPGLNNTGIQVIGPVLEVFDGWRYAIGISDISFLANTYVTSGLLATKNFTVPIDIKTVSLETVEVIPNVSTSGTFQWITYQMSVDGSTTWYDIAPQSAYYTSTPKQLLLNPTTVSAPSQSTMTINTPNYDPIQNPVTQIKMRAILSNQDDTLTPRLQSYTVLLQGIPQ